MIGMCVVVAVTVFNPDYSLELTKRASTVV
jgi:hypothetical protein